MWVTTVKRDGYGRGMGFGDNLKKFVTTAAKEVGKLQEMAEQQKVKQSQKEIEAEQRGARPRSTSLPDRAGARLTG